MKINMKRIKRIMKIELATLVIGLLILPGFFLVTFVFITTIYNIQEYNHSLFEWILAISGLLFLAWFIGTWVLELLRRTLFQKIDTITQKE
ncbi:MAG: hypothetical protein ACXAC8_17590 [Candidatus Hodarchaeales archaeon]|jgi:hypothetical protein